MSDSATDTAMATEPTTTSRQPTWPGGEADLAGLEELFASLSALCHQINNPLTSLLGRAQILQLNKSLDPAGVKAVAVIEDSAKRVANHVRELAAVVREGRERFPAASAETTLEREP